MSERETTASRDQGQLDGVEVLVTTALAVKAMARLQDVDVRLRVSSLSQAESALFASGTHLGSASPVGVEASLSRRLGVANVLITFPQSPINLGAHVPSLRWIQLLTAGADELPDRSVLQLVPVTTVREVRARPVAEYAMLLVLAFAKRLHESMDQQRHRTWRRLDLIELQGKTLGVVGLGSIGTEIARLGKAFGMIVVAIRRGSAGADSETADEILPPSELHKLLRRSDFVVLAAPSTPETLHLIGRQELRLMRREAVLINVARGALVDEGALLEALRAGELAGAGLDVFEREPLPQSSPFYDLANVIISSHNAGMTDRFMDGVLPILVENMQRFLAGKPLHNQIDPVRGY